MKKAKKSTKRSRATKRASSKPAAKRGKARQSVSVADRNEAEHFIEVLEANKQLARGSGPLPPGATHQVEPDGSGSDQVVRKRYSSI